MTPRAGLLALLWGLTGVLYLIIVLWSLPMIAGEAEDILPFDLRPLGYSLGEAGAFLNALSDAGRAQYLGPQRWLDVAFPVCLAAALLVSFSRLFPRRVAWALGAVAVLGMLADLSENHTVREMLVAEAVDAETVARASMFTLVKSLCATVAMTAVLIGAGRALWRRWRAS